MSNRDPLLDKDFLKQLDEYHIREVYAKLISLSDDEQPVREITGSVTSGSVKIDSKSSMRRTCSLQITTSKAYSITDVDWALRTKFKLQIGLKNFIDDRYDDIIYFKMGIYVITAYNVSLTEQGYTIALSGSDKMCLLNGNVNGSVAAETSFSEEWDAIPGTNRYQKKKIPIKTIIREAVHEYAAEPYSNIVINDLDTCGVELISYRAKNNPMYVYTRKQGQATVYNLCFEDSLVGQIFQNGVAADGTPVFRDVTVTDIDGNTELVRTYQGDGLTITHGGSDYTILKRADYGETIGFKAVDLTYPSDLVCKVGESITSMLDKIVKMLGEFEYFYDLDGHFVFQRKHAYFDTPWTNAVVTTESNGYNATEEYYDSTIYSSANTYVFEGGKLITSYQNKPNILSIKNDYSIWGAMKGVNGDLPIHLRCALDIKPELYFSKLNQWKQHHIAWCEAHDISLDDISQTLYTTDQYDWRELLYRMAKDCFELRRIVTDLAADLNDPTKIQSAAIRQENIDYLTELQKYYNDLLSNGYSAYYTDLLGFWPQLYRTSRKPYIKYKYDANGNLIYLYGRDNPEEDLTKTFTKAEWRDWQNNGYWNPEHFRYRRKSDGTHEVEIYNPDGLYFWFDFIDAEKTGLLDYSVAKLGRRPKVVNDNTVKSIFVRETPNVLFIDPNEETVQWSGNLHYARMNIPVQYSNYLVRSAQGKSAKEVLDSLIYQGTFYNETITLSAIPVYYLEPNTRIKVYDEMTGIDGDYLIDSISISLAHDGLSSITGTKAETRIL